MRSEHLDNHYIGIRQFISMVQETYQSFGARNKLTQIKANCVPCRISSQRVESPLMADLPEFRMDFTRTFTNTGVEYFGLFNVKMRRLLEKR